jgi:hypothetical protein
MAARGPAPGNAERWLSGRKHRTRNAACGQPYRGFESHPLRHATGQLVSPLRRSPKPPKPRPSFGLMRRGGQLTNAILVRTGAICLAPSPQAPCTVHFPVQTGRTGKSVHLAPRNRLQGMNEQYRDSRKSQFCAGLLPPQEASLLFVKTGT